MHNSAIRKIEPALRYVLGEGQSHFQILAVIEGKGSVNPATLDTPHQLVKYAVYECECALALNSAYSTKEYDTLVLTPKCSGDLQQSVADRQAEWKENSVPLAEVSIAHPTAADNMRIEASSAGGAALVESAYEHRFFVDILGWDDAVAPIPVEEQLAARVDLGDQYTTCLFT